MILLALIALVVIPPEKLPEFARQVARIFNEFRRSTAGIWDDLKQDAMLKPEDLMKLKSVAPPPPPEAPTVPTTTFQPDPVISPVIATEEKKPHE